MHPSLPSRPLVHEGRIGATGAFQESACLSLVFPGTTPSPSAPSSGFDWRLPPHSSELPWSGLTGHGSTEGRGRESKTFAFQANPT